MPIAGFTRFEESSALLSLEGMVGSADGARILSAGSEQYLQTTPPPVEAARLLGREVAANLIKRGADTLIRDAYAEAQKHAVQGNGSGDRAPYKWTLS